ncbi:hypothetical protein K474DRAFT_1604546 [Panus rudis PR-1116 ss-1]|nr:hypothetical protein K474DRAFT_1604546 [Panus rudis PR-1116 ss-1]
MTRARAPAGAENIRSYSAEGRKKRSYITRYPWRERQKKLSKKAFTPADKAARAASKVARQLTLQTAVTSVQTVIEEQALLLKEKFPAHTLQHLKTTLMQNLRVTATKREISLWNAFMFLIKEENKARGMNKKADQIAREAREEWSKMTPEEKVLRTKDAVEKLKEVREMKQLSLINVPKNAFADSRSTLASIKNQLEDLNARTGTETVLIAVRSSLQDYLPPQVFTTTPRINDLFHTLYGEPVEDYASHLEGYILSGVSKEAFGAEKAPRRMNYENFESAFTDTYGIVCEGWPLPVFQAPGNVRTREEMLALISAFEDGTARFRRLSAREMEQRAKGELHIPAVQCIKPTHSVTTPGPSSSATATSSPSAAAS